jgi:hypothetical protein
MQVTPNIFNLFGGRLIVQNLLTSKTEQTRGSAQIAAVLLRTSHRHINKATDYGTDKHTLMFYTPTS